MYSGAKAETFEGPDPDFTRLLAECRQGHKAAEAKLFDCVYRQLRELARRQMARESPGHTLQATALVHEAYLRLLGNEIDWQDRNRLPCRPDDAAGVSRSRPVPQSVKEVGRCARGVEGCFSDFRRSTG